jgi:hypothetical protein
MVSEYQLTRKCHRDDLMLKVDDRLDVIGGVYSVRLLGDMVALHDCIQHINNRKKCFAWIDKRKADRGIKASIKTVLSTKLFRPLPCGLQGRELLTICDKFWPDISVIRAFARVAILPRAVKPCSLFVPEGSISVGQKPFEVEDILVEAANSSMIFIPMHNSEHYALMVVELRRRRLFILDSMARAMPACVQAWHHAADCIVAHPKLKDLKRCWLKMEGGQKDKVSCGVFVVHFMEQFASDQIDFHKEFIKAAITASQLAAIRWRILVTLADIAASNLT